MGEIGKEVCINNYNIVKWYLDCTASVVCPNIHMNEGSIFVVREKTQPQGNLL